MGWNYADPLTSLELLNYYLTLAMSSGRFCIYFIQRIYIVNQGTGHWNMFNPKRGDFKEFYPTIDEILIFF